MPDALGIKLAVKDTSRLEVFGKGSSPVSVLAITRLRQMMDRALTRAYRP